MGEAVRVDTGWRPWQHQMDAHHLMEQRRFVVLVWHRRAGKTRFSIIKLVRGALACTLRDGRFAYLAPLLKQAKAVVWNELKKVVQDIPGCSVNEAELRVDLPNGASIRLYGADHPDSLRGLYFDGVVLDEVGQMKTEVWGEVVRPTLTDRKGWALFIGTPKGENLFSKLYYAASEDTSGEWGADLRRVEETPCLAPEEIEAARRSMAPSEFEQEYHCDFTAAVDNKLISVADVLEAQRRVYHETEYCFAPRILGVDVARSEAGDRTVLAKRQGNATFDPLVLRTRDLMRVTGEVARIIEDWKPHAVFVDVIGVGGGVVDRLNELKFGVIGVNSASKDAVEPRFLNLRMQMWWRMSEWIKAGGRVWEGQEIRNELVTPLYKIRSDGKYQLESKEDIKERERASPDLADALALTFAAPVAQPAQPGDHRLAGFRAAAGKALTEHSRPRSEWR